jgi:hypothetical protein
LQRVVNGEGVAVDEVVELICDLLDKCN